MYLAQPSFAHIAENFASLINTSHVLFSIFDENDMLAIANDAFIASYFVDTNTQPSWSGIMRSNYENKQGALIISAGIDAWLEDIKSRRGQKAFRSFEADLWDGRWLWMTETVDQHGWMMCIAIDITALKNNEFMLRHDRDQATNAANTDMLTGIRNRRFIMDKLSQLMCELKTPKDALSVVLVDLDNFKSINDNYGHPAGDEVIKDFANRAVSTLRATDLIGRIGGEEFMLLLPDISIQQVMSVIERLHEEINLSKPLVDFPHVGYTFSAGVTYVQAGENIKNVINEADQALYIAKTSGRNQTILASK